jgi:hypothetical protein
MTTTPSRPSRPSIRGSTSRPTARASPPRSRPTRPPPSRYRAKVDQWVNGSDIWGYNAWNAALLGQLTGEAKYCEKSVATVEEQVVAAEAKIAGGSGSGGRERQLPRDRRARRRPRAGLRLVLREPLRVAAHALDGLREPGDLERVEPERGRVGRLQDLVERVVGRQPVEQLLLLVPPRDDARRAREQGRERSGRRLDRALPRRQDPRPAGPDVRGRSRRRRLARRHGLRRVDAPAVRALRHVEGDDRRVARDQDHAHARVAPRVHSPDRADARSRRSHR